MNASKQRWTFISYSRRDKGFALELARELKSAGYLIWLDQLDIPTGARWDDEVERALRDSEIFLIILTPASTSSENVKDEIGYAIDNGKRILPVLLEECDIPLRLRRFQYVDFTTLEFADGVKRAQQILEILSNEHSTPVEKIHLGYEEDITSGKKTTSTAPTPIQNRPFRRRWIVGGAGILAITACLGALAALIISRSVIFTPLTNSPSETSTTATQTKTVTPTQTETPTAPPLAYGLDYNHNLTVTGGGGDGGDQMAPILCPPGYIGTGLIGAFQTYTIGAIYIDKIGLRCSLLNSDGTTGTITRTNMAGAQGGTAFQGLECQSNFALTKIDGQAGAYVDQIKQIYCASIPDSSQTYTPGKTPQGGSGGTSFTSACPPTSLLQVFP